MYPFLVFGLFVVVAYGFYLMQRRWGTAAAYFLAAAISLLSASGVFAERLLGPRWSWNFAHRSEAEAIIALVIGAGAFLIGLLRRRRAT